MALESGQQFGPYTVGESIGAGGMGEVWRGTDTNLKRDVAIKVLPASFADDADRLARFQREAEVLAALNHPNIAQIYGLEKSDGQTALVMELVEGLTLADRIQQGPIPTDDALAIARQIIDALDAAHSRGIVHRDLKPANVKLSPDGTVKVLDFGIAKAMDLPMGVSGPGQAQLTTPAMTQAGLVLGTAAYMSPEQARGRPVDQRTDVWAFGCVLYEMLTGQPAFGGEDVPITLARVLAHEADMATIPDKIPANVRHAIDLCLRKDPKTRLHAIGDVRLVLEGSLVAPAVTSEAGVASSGSAWRRTVGAALGALAVAAVVAWFVWPDAPPRPVNRFDYELPESLSLRNTGRNVIAISPDGRAFAYNTNAGIYLREMGSLEARLIAGTEPNLAGLEFSPDSRSIAYWDRGTSQLMRIAISGGAPVVIAEIPDNARGISWNVDGTILVGYDTEILRVADVGGTPETIIQLDDGSIVYGPRLLPDGDTILYTATAGGDWDNGEILAESLSTGEKKSLVTGGNDARYVATGHLVYALADDLFALAFDADSLEVFGGPVPVLQGISRAQNNQTGAANYGISDDGTLVYVPGQAGGDTTLAWVDRNGDIEVLSIDAGGYRYPRIAPDGRRVAIDDGGGNGDIWVWDFAAETRTRLNTEMGGSYPVWSHDSARIAYVDGEGVKWRAANNTGEIEVLSSIDEFSGTNASPYFFSADESTLVMRGSLSGGGLDDLARLTLAAEGKPEPLLAANWAERNAELSPNGRWMAYQSNETGNFEIYVRPYPDVDADLVQVSNSPAVKPLWSRDGTELYYLTQVEGSIRLMSVAVNTEEPMFSFGERSVVMTWPFLTPADGRDFDVSPDGQRFLAVTGQSASVEAPQVIVIQNWTEELKRQAPRE
jgi:serine/threonine protein kinase/Tol biopolymer transport system component